MELLRFPKLYHKVIKAVLLFIILSSLRGGVEEQIFRVQKVFEFPEIAEPKYVQEYKGKFYITDHTAHRITIVDKGKNRVVDFIGKPGQGPGELFRPTQLFIRDGYIYVYDFAYETGRVQIFKTDGKFVREIPLILKAWRGFAVNSKGEILLNQPQKGSLITIYDKHGKFVRSFGKLKTVSEIYGSKFSELDNSYKFAINRVFLSLDKDDNIFAVHIFAPIIQKYDSKGNLTKEVRIKGKIMDEIAGYFPKTDKPTGLVKTGIDGVLVYYFIKGAVVELKTRTLWVLIGTDNYFYLYDLLTLEKIEELYLDYSLYKGGIFYLFRSNGDLFFTTVLKPGCYKLELLKKIR